MLYQNIDVFCCFCCFGICFALCFDVGWIFCRFGAENTVFTTLDVVFWILCCLSQNCYFSSFSLSLLGFLGQKEDLTNPTNPLFSGVLGTKQNLNQPKP